MLPVYRTKYASNDSRTPLERMMNEHKKEMQAGKSEGEEMGTGTSTYGTSTKAPKIRLTDHLTYRQHKPLHVTAGEGKNEPIRQEWGYEDFVIKECVGNGAFGEVFRAREVTTGMTLALKVVELEGIRISDIQGLVEEVKVQSKLIHPNICRLYGYFYNPNYFIFVLEYCGGGTLQMEMKQQKDERFSPQQAVSYILQIAKAVRNCHRHHIMHRDLKPENILLDHNKQVKLSDFGWACIMTPNQRRITHGGTPVFNAPEVVNETSYGYASEVWSIGCVLYEMLYGKSPFEYDIHPSERDLPQEELRKIRDEEVIKKINKNMPAYPRKYGIDTDLICLMKDCIQTDERKRIKLKDIFQHPAILKHAPKQNVNKYTKVDINSRGQFVR